MTWSLRIPLGIVLGATLLASAGSARTTETFRLDRIAITHYTEAAPGKLNSRSGVLLLNGVVRWRPAVIIDRPANTPDYALNRNLVQADDWLAYYRLGSSAVSNFETQLGSVKIFMGDRTYYAVGVREDAAFANGRVINLSTRLRLSGATDSATAGFVITERPRTVLIRAIGPGLAPFGVNDPLPDPFLSLQRNGQTLVFNNNWWDQFGRAEVEQVTAMVGAFPLATGSTDAARVVTLQPGAYTVQVENAGPFAGSGTVLIEVYDVPADFDVD